MCFLSAGFYKKGSLLICVPFCSSSDSQGKLNVLEPTGIISCSKLVFRYQQFPGGKEPLCDNAGDIRTAGSILGLGRSSRGGHGNPFQYSFLENPMDRGAWGVAVHGVAKSWTQLKWLSMQAHDTAPSGDELGRQVERAVALVHDGFEFISCVTLGKLLHFSVT